MKTLISLIVAVLMAANAVNAAVLITEVYYDPVSTENGGEAVELYNTGDQPQMIGDWIIKTKSSAIDAKIPAGTILPSKTFYLIADTGWNISKDDSTWPNADYEEALTLSNTDGGVTLLNDNGTVLDSVGWGIASPPDFYEGTPADEVFAGNSLQRKFSSGIFTDSNNNSFDFYGSVPNLQSSTSSRISGTVDITINITKPQGLIKNASVLDDDSGDAGIQLIPFPGSNRSISVSVELKNGVQISDLNSLKIEFMSQEYNLTNVNDDGNGSVLVDFQLPFYQNAGNYSLQVEASDGLGQQSSSSQNIQVMEVSGISLDKNEAFLSGESRQQKITVKNIGNSNLDLDIRSTNFSSESSVIDSGFLSFIATNLQTNMSLNGNLKTDGNFLALNIQPGINSSALLLLSFSESNQTNEGIYHGRLSIVGVP
ncbi:MAG: lamin tail domain-containing protein [Nanoarchaeota archaeon]|nr:MAG: lamin tail domain-containing protein [Nanoarchaeota archaeon]